MDPEYVVFDVSSDDDVGWGEKLGVDDGGGDEHDDCDWIQQLLDEVDKDTEDSSESDDVMLVSEVVVNSKLKLNNSDISMKALEGDDDDNDDDDDDCVVLDGDPDKPERVDSNHVADEADELQVVAETGQVACRDYPHPRHLCVKYPFMSTPHEKHCNQCHCYVCDSLAPCLLWDLNHCHATDKEEIWINERKSLKTAHQVTIPVPMAPTFPTEVIQVNQDPVSLPFPLTYIPQNQVILPAVIRACSRATSHSIPVTDGSGYLVPRNRFRPNLVLQKLRGTGNEAINNDRRHVSNAGLQVKSPPSVFKRTGPGVPLMPNRKYYLPNQKYGSPCVKRVHPASTPVNNSLRWQMYPSQLSSNSNTCQLPSQPNIHGNFPNTLPYQPRPSARPYITNNLLNSVPPQPLVYPQSNTDNAFVNPGTPQSLVPSQPHFGSTFLRSMPSQAQVPSQPFFDPSQPFFDRGYVNTMPSKSQTYGQPNFAPGDYQSVQHLNQDPGFVDSNLADIDLSWVNLTNGSNQRLPPEHQDIGLLNKNEPLWQTEMDNLSARNTNLDALNFQYDNWTLENSDRPVHSPEPDFSDSSFFFRL